MRNFKYTIFGFFMFFLTTGFNVVLGVLVYNSIKEKSDIVVCGFYKAYDDGNNIPQSPIIIDTKGCFFIIL